MNDFQIEEKKLSDNSPVYNVVGQGLRFEAPDLDAAAALVVALEDVTAIVITGIDDKNDALPWDAKAHDRLKGDTQ